MKNRVAGPISSTTLLREALVVSCCTFIFVPFFISFLPLSLWSPPSCPAKSRSALRYDTLTLSQTRRTGAKKRGGGWGEEGNRETECGRRVSLFFPLGFVTSKWSDLSASLRASCPRSFETSAQVHYRKETLRLALGHFAIARWESKTKDTSIAYFCMITYKNDFKK